MRRAPECWPSDRQCLGEEAIEARCLSLWDQRYGGANRVGHSRCYFVLLLLASGCEPFALRVRGRNPDWETCDGTSLLWMCTRGVPSFLVKRLHLRYRSSDAGCTSMNKYPNGSEVTLLYTSKMERHLSGYICSNTLRIPVLSRGFLKATR